MFQKLIYTFAKDIVEDEYNRPEFELGFLSFLSVSLAISPSTHALHYNVIIRLFYYY